MSFTVHTLHNVSLMFSHGKYPESSAHVGGGFWGFWLCAFARDWFFALIYSAFFHSHHRQAIFKVFISTLAGIAVTLASEVANNLF